MHCYKNSEVGPPIMIGTPPPPQMRVPLIDWDRPPWSRWAFQHIRELIPTAAISRGDKVSDFPEALGDLNDFQFTAPGGHKTSFAQMLDDTYTDGMLVWKGGKTLHESYHNGMGPSTLHLLQSVSKSLTAAAAGGMVAEGLLDPAVPITDVLPELAATAWVGATLQQVLDMTSGVRFIETYEQRDSDVGKMDFAACWKPAPEGMDVSDWPQCIWDQILSLTVRGAEHGSQFNYRSIETDVLAHAMERVTGQRLPQILSERLWQPMGAGHDACITVDRAGYGLACGGINVTLRDLARFGLMLFNKGRVGDAQVIPEAWVDDIRHGAHGLYDTETAADWPNGAYRNQFWVQDSRLGRHFCLGVFGQMVFVAPDTGLMAVKLSSQPEFSSDEFFHLTYAALQAVERSF